MEAVLGDAPDHAVVADIAVVPEQQAIAAAPDAELRPWIGVHPLHEGDGIRTDYLDLAERRGVEDAETLAHGTAFAAYGGVHVLAGLGEIPRPAPLADRLEDRAVLGGPAVDLRLARHLEMLAAMVACESAEGGRRVGWAERGQPHLRLALAQRVGRDVQPVDVRHLALVGRHAVRGVTLDVLDRAHALAHGQAQVLGGYVVLVVDERLGAAGAAVSRQLFVRHAASGAVVVDRVGERIACLAKCDRHLAASLCSVLQGRLDAPQAAARSGDHTVLVRPVGQEGG